jgi:hypothetical protein
VWRFWIDPEADLVGGDPRRSMAWLAIFSVQNESICAKSSVAEIGNLDSPTVELDGSRSAG